VVPFAIKLGKLIPPVAVRLRRDFSTLLALISAHALLHRSTRAADQQGRIVATVADYAVVHDLVAKLFAEGIEATVPATVRETVEAVRAGEAEEVSLTLLAKKLGLDKNSAHHRVRKAIKLGYLANREEKRGKPARIAIADHLPDELEILPDPTLLECWSVGAGVKEEGDVSDGTPQAEPDKSPEIAIKPTAKTEKQPESGGLPEAAVTSTPSQPYPPEPHSNTPTPPTEPEETAWLPRAWCGCTPSAAGSGCVSIHSPKGPPAEEGTHDNAKEAPNRLDADNGAAFEP
jgi:hypothetical protein